MRLNGSDPDVSTIVARISRGDIVLQPHFQRGEVWGDAKKRRLIDSILREWHVPPIHVIQVKETAKQEVLDGQQRLVAIRDFAAGKLTVDGESEPFDPHIANLDGRTYDDLPDIWRRKFDQFTIRVFVITDYAAGEPGELFYRLNQPTNLTAAEQRNAFFGPARQQVKDLVTLFEEAGLAKDNVGFSNSRMAYDDVIAKLCLTLDNGTLREKVTAGSVTSKYRSQEPFRIETIDRLRNAISICAQAIQFSNTPAKFNKATLYSWLCLICQVESLSIELSPDLWGAFVADFEHDRVALSATYPMAESYLMEVYNDRASSRVSDVTSVLLRDLVLWVFLARFLRICGLRLRPYHHTFAELEHFAQDIMGSPHDKDTQDRLSSFLEASNWGSQI